MRQRSAKGAPKGLPEVKLWSSLSLAMQAAEQAVLLCLRKRAYAFGVDRT